LKVGHLVLGDVPVGSREYFFLHRLWLSLDQFVAYADLKRWVLEQTGATDSGDEASFCQKLKAQLKKRLPPSDGVIVASNKGDGYRLRRHGGGEGIWLFPETAPPERKIEILRRS
jgi:hypothetical protein